MRTLIMALAAGAAVGLATSAWAQQDVNAPHQEQTIPQGLGDGAPANYFGTTPSREQLYYRSLATLQDRMRKITARDGGQLTREHAAALQDDLDRLNRRFGIRRFANSTPAGPPSR